MSVTHVTSPYGMDLTSPSVTLSTVLNGINPTGARMSDTDFGDFTITTTHKPVAGVTVVEIPEALSKALAVEVPKVVASVDLDLHLTARDEKTAKMIAGWVKAWGARQEPKLYIRRLPNRRDQKDNTVRFSVANDADVPEENRPGRKVVAK